MYSVPSLLTFSPGGRGGLSFLALEPADCCTELDDEGKSEDEEDIEDDDGSSSELEYKIEEEDNRDDDDDCSSMLELLGGT